MTDNELFGNSEQLDDLISRRGTIVALKSGLLDEDGVHVWRDVRNTTINAAIEVVEAMPSAQPEIIYCKDCVKHNKGHGYYYDGTVIGIKDCCPLVEIRGRAQGHEFDYQFCAYAERRTDE